MSKTNFEFLDALGQIARDKGISVETLLDALANALVAAYKRRPDAAEEAVVTIDPDSGEIRVYGQELDEDGNVVREWDDTPDDFGRIAAQTAKQVILQRIREVERDLKYEEYAGREGDIVTGIVQQTDNRYTLLDLGKVEALLPQAEQVSYERYEHGARLKAYIVEVRKTTKGPQIVVSRSHPGLIKRLFELEVPEISLGRRRDQGGGPRARATARRSPCGRTTPTSTRSAPASGARGSRVRMVTNELRGERVDVVPVLRRPGRAHPDAPWPRPGCARSASTRRPGTATVIVERLPALAGHRQGGPERPPGRPADRLAHRHQERDPAGRGGGRATPARSGPRASGSRTRPARWCGSRPRAARPCRPRSGRMGRGPSGAGPGAEAPAAAARAAEPVAAEAAPAARDAAATGRGAAEAAEADGRRAGRRPRHSAATDLRRVPDGRRRPTSWSGWSRRRTARSSVDRTVPGAGPGCAGGRWPAWTEALRRQAFERAFGARSSRASRSPSCMRQLARRRRRGRAVMCEDRGRA